MNAANHQPLLVYLALAGGGSFACAHGNAADQTVSAGDLRCLRIRGIRTRYCDTTREIAITLIHELLVRIRWDPGLGKGKFELAYEEFLPSKLSNLNQAKHCLKQLQNQRVKTRSENPNRLGKRNKYSKAVLSESKEGKTLIPWDGGSCKHFILLIFD